VAGGGDDPAWQGGQARRPSAQKHGGCEWWYVAGGSWQVTRCDFESYAAKPPCQNAIFAWKHVSYFVAVAWVERVT